MFPPASITPPVLENYQWFYNGLTFGAGTPIATLKIEGIALADVSQGDVGWSRDYGQARGLNLLGGRDVIFDLWVQTNGESVQATMLELARASSVLPNEELPLWFKLPNLPTLAIMCRARKRSYVIDAEYGAANIAEPELSLHATDPRIYGAGEEVTIKKSETKTVTNAGNIESRPVLILNGPFAQPKLANNTIAGKPFLEILNQPAEIEEEEAEESREAADKALEVGNQALLLAILVKIRKEFEEGKKTKEAVEGAEKSLKEAEEKEPVEHKTAREKSRKEEGEARTKKEEKGELPTVKTGDQVRIDLGTPHVVQYFPGGITKNEPENIAGWVSPSSTWWSLTSNPEENELEFTYLDTVETAGSVVVESAPAYEL